jgi:hypothetical protein
MGNRIGHFQKRRHAAGCASARGMCKVFLMGQTGFSKVHLIIDHSRQKMETAGIDDLIGGGRGGEVDSGDFSILDQNGDGSDSAGQNDMPVFDECFHA